MKRRKQKRHKHKLVHINDLRGRPDEINMLMAAVPEHLWQQLLNSPLAVVLNAAIENKDVGVVRALLEPLIGIDHSSK